MPGPIARYAYGDAAPGIRSRPRGRSTAPARCEGDRGDPRSGRRHRPLARHLALGLTPDPYGPGPHRAERTEECRDVNFCDGSKPATRIAIEGDFLFRGLGD